MAAAGVIASLEVPSALEAREPPEARGLARDEVRLMVSDLAGDTIEHARFRDLPRWLGDGDVLVVNTSGTLSAALPAKAGGGVDFDLHLSTRLPGGFWTVELRDPDAFASRPSRAARPGLTLHLPAGGRATLLSPYPAARDLDSSSRLWLAAVHLPGRAHEYLARHGFPIRYRYVPEPWPPAMYQTIFATEPGSAEMPSAGRPFTADLVARLAVRGVQFAPLLLHAGVASLEDHEPPYEEYYRVPRSTADRVNAARRDGRRIVAVGTTAVRALETVTDAAGVSHPGEGWTSLIVCADRPLRSVDSLITGLHEPRATHLAVLERVVDAALRRRERSAGVVREPFVPGWRRPAGSRHLERAYAEAAAKGYLWHEFGDSHLILAGPL
jgi:S-adenosylmethionine:tRNA ribosyltransferase-isomerase